MDLSCNNTNSSPIIDKFIDPPAYSLPEKISSSIRKLIEYQDLEWSRRHPNCVRRKWETPDSAGLWGPECKGCFTLVSAMDTIWMLEIAISLHRSFRRRGKNRGKFLTSLREVRDRLKLLQQSMESFLGDWWSKLFFVREDMKSILPTLTQLNSLLEELASNSEGLPESAESSATQDQNHLLANLLGRILGKGSLNCFVVRSDDKLILSPGMETLLQCLAECGCSVTALEAEAMLDSKSRAGGCQTCLK